jgi:hypothetical protein
MHKKTVPQPSLPRGKVQLGLARLRIPPARANKGQPRMLLARVLIVVRAPAPRQRGGRALPRLEKERRPHGEKEAEQWRQLRGDRALPGDLHDKEDWRA